MSKIPARPLAGAFCLVLLALALVALVAAPVAADHGEKKVRIHKMHHDCDGEDCEHEGEHRAIFIGEGGEVHHLDGEHALRWIGAGDHGVHIFGGSTTFLGVQLTELTDELRQHFGVPEGRGVMVAKVVDDSPAARAGVQVGDIVTAVDGEEVKGPGTLQHLIGDREEGETIALELYRDGRIETLSPTLAKREMKALHGGHHGMRQIRVHCEDEDGEKDCEVNIGEGGIQLGDFDCGGAAECRVEVDCRDEGCECTANGEPVDCSELPGFAERHGE